GRPLPGARPDRRRRVDQDRHRQGALDEAGPESGHLRRARRRAEQRRVLRQGGHELRVVLAVPRADGPPRRGAGGAAEVIIRRGTWRPILDRAGGHRPIPKRPPRFSPLLPPAPGAAPLPPPPAWGPTGPRRQTGPQTAWLPPT